MKKLLLIDNYDSFTYNLVQYFQSLGVEVNVKRNDEIDVDGVATMKPDFLVFSPGPGTVENPEDIGNGEAIMKKFIGKIPILGVCLGHQLIGKLYGGKIIQVEPQHGKRWPIKVLDKSGLFKDFPDTFEGMRYHSLVVTVPLEKGDKGGLTVTSVSDDEDQHIMSFELPEKNLYGVQFHPESIGTPDGLQILKNFLNL